MSNVNNLNGIPNFGHGEEVVPTVAEAPTIDEAASAVETEVPEEKVSKAKKSKR